jgi:hypothetical protein
MLSRSLASETSAEIDDSTIATAMQKRINSVCQRRLRTDAS